MAERISTSQYKEQADEYTKKALAELNSHLNGLFQRKREKDVDAGDSDEDNLMVTRSKKKKLDCDEDRSLRKYERKMRELQDNLQKEETKSHYLILDLSNCKCELESVRESLKQSEEKLRSLVRIKCLLMVYLFIINIFFCTIWYALPFQQKLFFTPMTSFSFYCSYFFKTHFYSFAKKNLKTK